MPDAAFPGLHIRPAQGWLNDPNGVSRIDGRYHVFFQYNPDQPRGGSICWGHVSSDDLLHWTEEPVALRPRPGKIDAGGCWSGCVVDDGGVPTALYTANPDHAWNGAAVLARSDRTLREWQQTDTALMVRPEGDSTIEEVRDPFVFGFDGRRYIVQGAGAAEGRPQLLLYGADDLEHWTQLGALLDYDDEVAVEHASANIWECPGLVLIDGVWVLLLSRWRRDNDSRDVHGVSYLIGDLVRSGDGLRFVATGGGAVDDGPAFYAPQPMTDGERVLLWGWSWELRDQAAVDEAGWAGALTFPRQLNVLDGRLVSRPAQELAKLRKGEVRWTSGNAFSAAAFEVIAEGPWSLAVLTTDGVRPAAAGRSAARILVDGSLVEVFTDATPYTTRSYPADPANWMLIADPATTTIYALGLG